MSSSELVPMSCGRAVWNTLHNTDLAHYEGAISSEKIEEINEVYDIRLYLGTHGSAQRTGDAGMDAIIRPTQREYAAVEYVINSLSPQDTLFIENYGYSNQAPSPLRQKSEYMRKRALFRAITPRPDIVEDIAFERRNMRDDIEAQRQSYLISAWDYAHRLAHVQGVRTVFADVDAYQESLFLEHHSGLPVPYLHLAGDEQLVSRVHAAREQRVAKTVSHCALYGLDAARTAQRKPVLAILFGRGHSATLPQVLKDEGLDVSLYTMNTTDNLGERAIEQLNFAGSKLQPQW